jgi:uncharacterized protein YkwD
MKTYILKQGKIISLLVILTGIFLLPSTAYLSTISEEKIIELTNIERQKNNLNGLSSNPLLTQAAKNKAFDLIKYQKFEHNLNGQKFSSWIKTTGYQYSFAGENLAVDFVTSEGVLNAWLASKSHRENILNSKFTEIGVAIVEGKFQNKNSILVVQIFGTPLATLTKRLKESKPYFYTINENLLSYSLNYNEKIDRKTMATLIQDKQINSGAIINFNETYNFNIKYFYNFIIIILFCLLLSQFLYYFRLFIINKNKTVISMPR